MANGNEKAKISVMDNLSARRAGREAVVASVTAIPDPEVPAKPTRRRFTAEYTLPIFREAERQHAPGALGALLRREGLYSTHLTAWRRQRDAGALESWRGRRRGRKPDSTASLRAQIAALEAEKTRLEERLRHPERFVRTPPEPPTAPVAVWINRPGPAVIEVAH